MEPMAGIGMRLIPPAAADWAKSSDWASDTGGNRDADGAPTRAQHGDWKTWFEEVRSASSDPPENRMVFV